MRLAVTFLLSAAGLWAARYGLDDASRTVRLSDPQIAPDGKSIALVVSRANLEENRYDVDVVLIDVATRGQRQLTRNLRSVTQPRWSPDGSRLAFLANIGGKPQLLVLPLSGGEHRQITDAASGVQQFAWRPGGAEIAYVTLDEPGKRTGPERHNKSFEVQHNHFLLLDAPRPARMWLAAAMGGTPKRLTSGDWTLPASLPPGAPSSPLSWSPDGKTLALVKLESVYTGDSDRSSVQLLDVETGALRPLTKRVQYETQPAISPDGSRVAHWFPRNGETKRVNEIYVGPVRGGETAGITGALDRNVQRAIWMPGSRSLLVSANDGTGVGLWIQPIDGSARRLDLEGMVPTATFWLDASVGPKGEIALTGTAPGQPAELYYLASTDAKPQRLTAYNREIAALELGRTETVHWDNDGFHMDGVVTYPPGYQVGTKYPLVLHIHGGPRSASKLTFSSRPQLLAARGWIVFEPNYRGSDNLGDAFQSAIWNDAGAGPGRDVMAGVALLERRGIVDPARIAVSGWSYGGYMTSWLLGNYPERWKAAVAGAAVTDLMDQYNLGDANVRRGSALGGSPYTDAKRRQAFADQSPITYAARIKAPTLILCDTGDYRVPITQSYSLYHALRDNGVTTQFIAYPVAGHSPTDPVHARDVDRRWVEWLAKYLGN